MNDNFYEQLIQEAPIGYAYHKIICDDGGIPCDYEFIDMNSTFKRLTGLIGLELIGKRVTEISSPIISEAGIDRIKIYGNIAINGGSKEFEDFSEALQRWYKIKVYSPEKYYFITYLIDVTKEMHQLTELNNLLSTVQESESMYKALADYANGWLTWEDGAGRLKYVSPACERISGYTVEEFVENESLFASIIIEEDKAVWLNHRHEISHKKGAYTEHFRIRSKQGEIVWIEHTCRPAVDKDGMNLGYRANNRDITERKLAEWELDYQNEEIEKRAAELEIAKDAAEEMTEDLLMILNELAIKETEQILAREKLIKSQEDMASILESMTDCFCAFDSNWQLTYINRAGEIAFGKSRDELLGKNIAVIHTINDTVLLYFDEVMIKKRSVSFEIFPEALGNKWFEISAYPTENGMICYFRDITSRKIAEKEFARHDRLDLVGQLAAGIAHEIRNPMTTVRGYLQLLGSKPEYEAKKATFDLMISELDRANAIITEFLSLAQTKPTELKSQNLNDILNHLYPLLEADTFTRNKQINFISGDIPNLKLNGKEISQLVLNLVRNGLEAMEERGSLTIKSYVDNCKVVLAISDEGCGISQENLSKLGIPFFTTKDNGTGLGLASCYKIAEYHNAKINIDTSPRGTTFYILFPIPE